MDKGQRRLKQVCIILSVTFGLITIMQMTAVGASRHNSEKFDIGDYSSYNVSQVEEQFLKQPTNSHLLLLIKVLCYQQEIQQNTSAGDLLEKYGNELLDRAKSEELDLQTIDDEKVMLQILKLIRSNN